jgi:predicted hotdog family 3-hydroxylacyl-ACP dehydratase
LTLWARIDTAMTGDCASPSAPALPATLDAAGIAARVPHAGAMCLLAALTRWDATTLCCTAGDHTAPDHPLRHGGVLPASAAIEYASQAMALHGTLSAQAAGSDAPPRGGFLASVRAVHLHHTRLDDAPGPLQVRAERLAGDARQAMYRFALHDAAGRLLVEGRATVVLDAEPLRPAAA